MKIEFTSSPISTDLEFLTKKIKEKTNDFGTLAPLTQEPEKTTINLADLAVKNFRNLKKL